VNKNSESKLIKWRWSPKKWRDTCIRWERGSDSARG